MSQKSFFTHVDGGRAQPTRYAASLWGPDSLNGPAVCGLAAYAAEREHAREGWLPARFTIELFKAARQIPTGTEVEVLRDGRRIRVVQVRVLQFDGEHRTLVAQANTVFLKQGTNPPGARWARPAEPIELPDASPDDPHQWYWNEELGWSQRLGAYQGAGRRRLWSNPIRVLDDVALTPFQRAVIAAEATSLATNWGEGGIGFINNDLTVALSRLPEGVHVGLDSDQHLEDDGVSAGTATLFDERGPFGIGMVTAVDNTRAMIDFTKVSRPSTDG